MDTTPGVPQAVKQRRRSDLIGQFPSRNLHLGIRLAETLGLDLNLFVTLTFSEMACTPEIADRQFAKIRETFGKWVRRPGAARRSLEVPPTFVWVIENPYDRLNAHWVVHVPPERQHEFRAMLPKWVEDAVGEVYSDKAIKVKPVTNVEGLKAYLLKGLHPSLCRQFGIRYENQGWVWGRRIGHSKNIGPRQVSHRRALGQFPPARRWINMPKAA